MLSRLFLAQRGLCFHCRKPMLYAKADGKKGVSKFRYNREHVIPKVKGGGRGSNIVLTHAVCNRERGHSPATPEMKERAKAIWDIATRLTNYQVEEFSRDRSTVGTFCYAYKWPISPPITWLANSDGSAAGGTGIEPPDSSTGGKVAHRA